MMKKTLTIIALLFSIQSFADCSDFLTWRGSEKIVSASASEDACFVGRKSFEYYSGFDYYNLVVSGDSQFAVNEQTVLILLDDSIVSQLDRRAENDETVNFGPAIVLACVRFPACTRAVARGAVGIGGFFAQNLAWEKIRDIWPRENN